MGSLGRIYREVSKEGLVAEYQLSSRSDNLNPAVVKSERLEIKRTSNIIWTKIQDKLRGYVCFATCIPSSVGEPAAENCSKTEL